MSELPERTESMVDAIADGVANNPASATVSEPEQEPETKEISNQRRLRRYRYLLPTLIFVAFLVWGFTANYIPSESMLPTLKPGDHVLTMRAWLAYPGGRMPSRGDIIVFAIPDLPYLDDYGTTDEKREFAEEQQKQVKIPPGSLKRVKGEILIKRVVGLPGETVQVIDNKILINGRELNQAHFGGTPDVNAYFNFGVSEPLTLKAEQLFVLGDNMANSEDSRTWGPLDRHNVIGKLARVLWNDGGKKADAQAEPQTGEATYPTRRN